MISDIQIYNTKSRKLEKFVPISDGKVSIYSCGPTVYHYQHLGNMRAAVFADTLHKMFLSANYEIKHIINITDVGHLTDDGDAGVDKMQVGAEREGKSVFDIAKMYTDAYFRDLEKLGISLEDYTFPRATENIEEQISLVQKLEEKGYTYKISDGIYFDTSKFYDYGGFAHLDIEGLRSGARVEENTEKKNITDFALWKFSYSNGRSFDKSQDDGAKRRQMEWDSPWGIGFPGWHIECSAMSMKYLGEHFDIHTGGIEHIPVHHTNEIAQSQCATGEEYVNYWMHNNHLHDTTGKMAKSTGDFLTLSSLIEKGYDPISYRYFLLTAHYRKELSFSFESLDSAVTAYRKLSNWCEKHITTEGEINNVYEQRFLESLYNDLGTPSAVGEMHNLLNDKNVNDNDKYKTLLEMSKILGLGLEKIKSEVMVIPDNVKILLEARASARLSGNYKESDRLRDEIKSLGFILKDTDAGQKLDI